MLLIRANLPSTRFGSKVGREAIASSRPLRGSIATTEPHLPASCCIATRWAPGLTVSQTWLPLFVAPRILSGVALGRGAGDLVERRLGEGAEVRVRAGQVVVQRRLEPGTGARLRRVADQMREQAPLRVMAQVELLPADFLDPVRGQDRAVGGADQAAADRELRHALDLVVLPVGEAGAGPGLPVGRADDQRGQEADADEREARDLPVHARSAFARLETSRRPASRTKLATTLEPP